jgi:hypothetical protein
LVARERWSNGFVKEMPSSLEPVEKTAYPPIARTEPAIEDSMAFGKLQELAAEFRRNNPFVTPEAAFSHVYLDPANVHLQKAERRHSRERLADANAAPRLGAVNGIGSVVSPLWRRRRWLGA